MESSTKCLRNGLLPEDKVKARKLMIRAHLTYASSTASCAKSSTRASTLHGTEGG